MRGGWNALTAGERRRIRELRHRGWRVPDIVAETGRCQSAVYRVIEQAGGVPPRGRRIRPGCLRLAEREEISLGLARGHSFAAIARGLDRSTSTVSREVGGAAGRSSYRAWAGECRAATRACRPKPAKLASQPRLRAVVEELLEQRWSPQQIAGWLRVEHADDPTMWVSPETIYQSLFVQGRGALRQELTRCLRTGRAQRRPAAARSSRRGHLRDMVLISERPAEVEDRAVPGHWEGDLIKGAHNRSAIGTLVERSTRFVLLLHLADGFSAEQVRAAMTARIQQLPVALRRSLTWDRGKEMGEHLQFTVDTGVQVFFCDPYSPWQRGSNENTNGLLRQYFPKGTDLAVHSRTHLDMVERQLNGRPRETLGWGTPAEKLAELVAMTA